MGQAVLEGVGVSEPYPVIEVRGSPLEMGRQHGQQAKAQVDRMMDWCFGHTTSRLIGGRERDVIAHAETLLPVAEAYAPDLVEECRGIAAGSGHDFREVFAMQYFVEWVPPSRRTTGCCSTALAVASAHPEGHTLVGWNDDMSFSLAPTIVILRSFPDSGPPITGICFAGTIPECGANPNLALACNSLPAQNAVEGVPYLFVPRRALQQSRLRDAVAAVVAAQRVAPMNYLVVSRGGDFVDIETSPEGFCLATAPEDIYAHTNHYLSREGAATQPGWAPGTSVNSQLRYLSLQRFLNRHRGTITWEKMLAALSDHDSSLCNHGGSTVTCMICDLTARRIAFSTGPPCLGHFQEFGL